MASAIAAVVILIIGLVVFVPFMVRRGLKARKTSQNFIPELMEKTGLQQSGDAFSGTFKGFQTKLKFDMGVNYAEMGAKALTGLAGGGTDFHSRSIVNPKFEVTMTIPVGGLPPLVLKEKVGILRTDEFLNEMLSGQKVDLPEIKFNDIKIKKVRIFGNDETFARKVASSSELQQLLSTWHFTDIRISGNEVKLILDDNMVQATFGSRLMSPDYVVQGVNICARAAQAASG